MLSIEAGLVCLALLLALTVPNLGSTFFASVERRLSLVAERCALSVLLVGLLALALRMAVIPIEPIPSPLVHDEFGYLLAADTFVHGRLTNPTHPMWQHFETFSEIQQPTYQCFAQPGQGMLLAFGKVVFGNPFAGVLLSVGIMCAAITWMLQSWMSPQWALLGGVIAVLRFGVFGYWANSYWGGALGAIGGALALGALPRIKSWRRIVDAIIMSLGLLLLANSRPYEGFVLSVPIAAALFAWMFGPARPAIKTSFLRVVAPVTIILVLGITGMGYYNWRLTGSPLRMAYQVERETYATAPYFLWERPLPTPGYRHAVMRKMYVDDEFKAYSDAYSLFSIFGKGFWLWTFYFGPVLIFPIVILGFVAPTGVRWRDIAAANRFLILAFLVSVAGLVAETFFHPHYAAPITSLLLCLVLLAMRELRPWSWRGRAVGLFLARTIPVICVASLTVRAFAEQLHIPRYQLFAPAWHQYPPPSYGRELLMNDLRLRTGRHLVLVRYKPDHDPSSEWVYNDADIDNSTIVWAREMSSSEDKQLIDYFHDRKVWLLEADEKPPRLVSYEAALRYPSEAKSDDETSRHGAN